MNNKIPLIQDGDFDIKQSIKISTSPHQQYQQQITDNDQNQTDNNHCQDNQTSNTEQSTNFYNKKNVFQQSNNINQQHTQPDNQDDMKDQIKFKDQLPIYSEAIQTALQNSYLDDPGQSSPSTNQKNNSQNDNQSNIINTAYFKLQITPTSSKKINKQFINNFSQLNDASIAQSTYMLPGKANQPQKQQIKNQVIYKLMDKNMYWSFGQNQLQINYKTLTLLHQNFYKNKYTMIPLISQQQFKSAHIFFYMEIYTNFLNQFFKKQFIQQIQNLRKMKHSQPTQNSSILSSTFKKQNPTLPKKNYYEYLTNYFKQSNYSKAQILLNYIILKYSTYSLIQQQFISKYKFQPYLLKKQNKKTLQKQISYLQLLISFQHSFNYCKQTLQDTLSQKWKQYQRNLNQLRKTWIKSVQSHSDFVFEI